VYLAAVVGPRHPEDDLPLRLADPADDTGVDELGPALDDRDDAVEDLPHRLMELVLAGVAAQHVGVEGFEAGHGGRDHAGDLPGSTEPVRQRWRPHSLATAHDE
jgi:hypothetical protein